MGRVGRIFSRMKERRREGTYVDPQRVGIRWLYGPYILLLTKQHSLLG
jgi:hypothetical protein